MIKKEIKPTLIIGCSEAKSDEQNIDAFSMYQGGIFNQLRCNVDSPQSTFNILILSAKYGLIKASDYVAFYDQRMVSKKDNDGIEAFALQHREKALIQLKEAANISSDLFVILSNDYLAAFQQIIKGKESQYLNKFQRFYISEGHRGIGDLRGRLGRIIKYVLSGGCDAMTDAQWHKSGISNPPELGYLDADCDIGISLARVNCKKNNKLLMKILSRIEDTKIFVDNGLITNIKDGKCIDTNIVFQQYKDLVEVLDPKYSKNVSMVIPDHVSSNQAALDIVIKHKEDILQLNKSLDVILPIHRSDNIGNHAMSMMDALGFPKGIRLGVPCLSNAKVDLMLSIRDIDSLLSLRAPDGAPLFSKIHYFGMGQSSNKAKLKARMLIAHLHGIQGGNLAFDVTRTAALFGKKTIGLRKGSALQKKIIDSDLEKQVKESSEFQMHDFYEEYMNPESYPIVTENLYLMINEDEVGMFIQIYNMLLRDHYHWQLPELTDTSDADEAMEVVWNMVSQRAVDRAIFEELKNVGWMMFYDDVKFKIMSGSESRYLAIKKLFSRGMPEGKKLAA